MKIELNKDTMMQGTLWTGFFITDNEQYNTPENRKTILSTGKIDYGETRESLEYLFNQHDYNFKKVVLSFPLLDLNNLVWKIAD